MFVERKRRYDRDGDPKTVEWAVQVIDSSRNPHGVAQTAKPDSPYQRFRDSRAVGSVEHAGAGRRTRLTSRMAGG